MKKAALPLVLFAVFIAVWQAVCVKGGVSPILLPSPADTFAYLVSSTREGLLPQVITAANTYGLRDVTTAEPTLETVFIRLTGRDLRE